MAFTPNSDLRKLQKNYIINGDMRISQRFAGTTIVSPGNGQYTVDRWQYIKVGAMTHNIVRASDVPTVAQAGQLFQNSLLLTLTGADTSIAATDYCAIGQIIEGYNFARLAQKDFTISFWVKATLPGTYSVGLQNSAADRGYAGEYTIDATNTWEYKTVKIAASPAAGTWNYTNGVGVKVWFTLAAGSNFRVAPDAWTSSTVLSSTNQINGVDTGATNFWLTGVMINEGLEAQPFRLFSEDVGGEIEACQRYYEKSYQLETTPGTVTSEGYWTYSSQASGAVRRITMAYRTRKRTTPSVIIYSPGTGVQNNVQRDVAGDQAVSFTIAMETGWGYEIASAAADPRTYAHFSADAELS